MSISFKKADILIPKNIDMEKWSVVACDQYTSQPEYWKQVEKEVGGSNSSLHLIFPEIFLSEGEARIHTINETMKKYLSENIFAEYKNSLIYLKRRLACGKIRQGLVGAVDLEDYTFEKGSTGNIRATEGTVLDRIPPRVKIRENASLELPHIMVLIDDPNHSVIEPLEQKSENLKKVYDFELMQDGGHIMGYQVPVNTAEEVLSAIEDLSRLETFNAKYNLSDALPMTFAVGDGNHSLATAKMCWENLKKTLPKSEWEHHPARYALVELVNLHDPSLVFEPIHRVMFHVNPEQVLDELAKFYPETAECDNAGKPITCIWKGNKKVLWIKDDANHLTVGTLQTFIDHYLKNHSGEVDYIHGDDVVTKLSAQDNALGFLLPAMEKSDLFKTVILDGALPRKTFSMGEACEKRFYLESKRIK